MSIKSFFSFFFAKYIIKKNSTWKENALSAQKSVFNSLIKNSSNTLFGVNHNFSKILTYSDWKKEVPIRNYEDLSYYIDKIKNGEPNVLWKGVPLYFCKTSGTTSGTKYIECFTKWNKH